MHNSFSQAAKPLTPLPVEATTAASSIAGPYPYPPTSQSPPNDVQFNNEQQFHEQQHPNENHDHMEHDHSSHHTHVCNHHHNHADHHHQHTQIPILPKDSLRTDYQRQQEVRERRKLEYLQDKQRESIRLEQSKQDYDRQLSQQKQYQVDQRRAMSEHYKQVIEASLRDKAIKKAKELEYDRENLRLIAESNRWEEQQRLLRNQEIRKELQANNPRLSNPGPIRPSSKHQSLYQAKQPALIVTPSTTVASTTIGSPPQYPGIQLGGGSNPQKAYLEKFEKLDAANHKAPFVLYDEEKAKKAEQFSYQRSSLTPMIPNQNPNNERIRSVSVASDKSELNYVLRQQIEVNQQKKERERQDRLNSSYNYNQFGVNESVNPRGKKQYAPNVPRMEFSVLGTRNPFLPDRSFDAGTSSFPYNQQQQRPGAIEIQPTNIRISDSGRTPTGSVLQQNALQSISNNSNNLNAQTTTSGITLQAASPYTNNYHNLRISQERGNPYSSIHLQKV